MKQARASWAPAGQPLAWALVSWAGSSRPGWASEGRGTPRAPSSMFVAWKITTLGFQGPGIMFNLNGVGMKFVQPQCRCPRLPHTLCRRRHTVRAAEIHDSRMHHTGLPCGPIYSINVVCIPGGRRPSGPWSPGRTVKEALVWSALHTWGGETAEDHGQEPLPEMG